jgi:hypothetical protein
VEQCRGPLYIKSYEVSFETEPMTIKGGDISIPAKGEYKSFSSCGMCPEPRVFRRLRVGSDGLHDLGTSDGEPEMRCIDELWDRLIHGQPPGDLAAPEVVAALRPIVEDVKRAAKPDLDYSLGMIEFPKVSVDDADSSSIQRPRRQAKFRWIDRVRAALVWWTLRVLNPRELKAGVLPAGSGRLAPVR